MTDKEKPYARLDALHGLLWTVRRAIAMLEEYFNGKMPAESQVELDGIIANLHFRESELERLISKMQKKAAK